MPLQGDISFVCVLGSTSKLSTKIDAARNSEEKHIHLLIPKLDIESKFKDELVEFMVKRGASLAFDDNDADFTPMCKDPNGWYIETIIQKTKAKTDEIGLEAAAATAVIMNEKSAMEDPYEIIDFLANKPFTFYIYSGLNAGNAEMLFYGQMVK